MRIQRATLNTCGVETDTVVVIDVLRAFTTAAYAFGAGAREIFMVATLEEAFSLRRQNPSILLMGESEGYPVKGFNLSNSPTAIEGMDLSGRRIALRSSAGTQGATRSANAERILVASLCCARATAAFTQLLKPQSLTFVQTGVFSEIEDGDEDVACADMIIAYLQGEKLDSRKIVHRVRNSRAAQKFLGSNPAFPESDLDLATQVDRFNFAMATEKMDNMLVLRPFCPAIS
jgi:2-phosphosulfolactate phosphatase